MAAILWEMTHHATQLQAKCMFHGGRPDVESNIEFFLIFVEWVDRHVMGKKLVEKPFVNKL